MAWFQHQLRLKGMPRGFHRITDQVLEAIPEVTQTHIGLLHVFIQHTSASLTITENVSPDVWRDLERSMNEIAPESFPYEHSLEGSDDMPAHVKASLLGNSVTIPVRGGRLCLGTWQGIFLCEHRNSGGPRHLVLTLQGEPIAR